MASKKELVEAQSFSRRRLLTAFVSGAPGGRELEPTSPVRGVVAGVVLAVLVVAGGLGSGLLNRGLPDGWENGRIMLVGDNAARYVTDDGQLVPILNMASARLLVEPGAPIHTVRASLVEGIPVLAPAGIVGAPDNLPGTDRLVDDGWQACLALDGGTATSLGSSDGAASGDSGAADDDAVAAPAGPPASMLALVGDQVHLVQGGYSYLLGGGEEQSGLLRELGFGPDSPRPAREEWLALVTPGETLAPYLPEGVGGVPAGDLGQIAGVTVGTVVQREETGQEYVALADGRLAPLNSFTAAIYRTAPGVGAPVSVPANALASVADVPAAETPFPRDWPQELGVPLTDAQPACAELSVADFGATLVAGDGDVPERSGVTVAQGGGALALFAAEADTTSGPVRFVDENGTAYAVEAAGGGTRQDALNRLFSTGGSDVVVPVVVPYAWGDLFASGPTLSIEAAQRSRTEVPAAADAASEGGTP
ncbi:type VII secretion protein EccB [Serinibacter arcticus]|uniref:Putative CONSERVED MEMBRANE PROTEIN n=1 Tax=Serinibacter arcticus TaxID=1655435 RepID=A0A4Z1E6A4_9MICO|nr:type VII secretion protein EccB [Serinibacter arcticus]TGO06398.1 putative CONSERVED MEMBRANE PROTEIN [Serinibacter arcticus]